MRQRIQTTIPWSLSDLLTATFPSNHVGCQSVNIRCDNLLAKYSFLLSTCKIHFQPRLQFRNFVLAKLGVSNCKRSEILEIFPGIHSCSKRQLIIHLHSFGVRRLRSRLLFGKFNHLLFVLFCRGWCVALGFVSCSARRTFLPRLGSRRSLSDEIHCWYWFVCGKKQRHYCDLVDGMLRRENLCSMCSFNLPAWCLLCILCERANQRFLSASISAMLV